MDQFVLMRFKNQNPFTKGKTYTIQWAAAGEKTKRAKPKQNGMRNNNMDKKESESQLFH